MHGSLALQFLGLLLSRTGQVSVRDNNYPKQIYTPEHVRTEADNKKGQAPTEKQHRTTRTEHVSTGGEAQESQLSLGKGTGFQSKLWGQV